MKSVIIIAIAFVLLIPLSAFAQTQSNIGTLYIEKDTYKIPYDNCQAQNIFFINFK